MDYGGWITAACGLLEIPVVAATTASPTNAPAFNSIIPAAIDYTENRLQRDLDFLATIITNPNGVMVANSRTLTLPSSDLPNVASLPLLVGTPMPAGSTLTTTLGSNIVAVHWPNHGMLVGQNCSILNPVPVGGLTLGGVFNVHTVVDANNLTILAPSNATSSQTAIVIGNGIFIVTKQIRPIVGGVRQQPLEWVTRDYLDFAWPDETSPGANILPVQVCPVDQVTVLVGPAPDQAYGFETVGTMRIPKLSATNFTNFLTQQFPDLYVAASMVFFFGFQRDFGGQASDPQTAQSWENQYKTLLTGAGVEEIRKRFADMYPSPTNPSAPPAQA